MFLIVRNFAGFPSYLVGESGKITRRAVRYILSTSFSPFWLVSYSLPPPLPSSFRVLNPLWYERLYFTSFAGTFSRYTIPCLVASLGLVFTAGSCIWRQSCFHLVRCYVVLPTALAISRVELETILKRKVGPRIPPFPF